MNIFKKILIILFIVLVCTGCDQSTKYLATEFLEPNSMISYANDIFRLQYAENKGAFLGLGNTLSEESRFSIFTVAVSCVLLLLFLHMVFSRKIDTFQVVVLSVVLGGGFSNLIDRVVNNGAVVDFLNLGIGQLRTGIFNIADIFIMLGFTLLIFHSHKYKERIE